MLLTPEAHADIAAAIRAAEQGTSGEIYCVVAEEASDYAEAPIAAGALAALVLPALLLLAGLTPASWAAAHVAAAQSQVLAAVATLLIAQGVLFVLVAALASIPAVRRLITPAPLKRMRVRERALEQFLAKNLQRTQRRTGVLIFVSLADRMAELLADEGVNKLIAPGAWEAPMASLTQAMRKGELVQGLQAAIAQCGALLAQHAPGSRDDVNELPDAVAELPRV